jgi:hypothetical protein
LVNVYGPCTGEHREAFVQWLYDLNIPTDEDWLLLVILILLDHQAIGINLEEM